MKRENIDFSPKQKLVTSYYEGLNRESFYNHSKEALEKSGNAEKYMPTLDRMISAIKQIGISSIVTGANKHGEEKVVAWCGDHIYTLNIPGLIDVVRECTFKFDEPVEENKVPNNLILKLDDTDTETAKKLVSTN